MTNLWILTEERPKKVVIEQILSKFGEDKKLKVKINNLTIMPIIKDGKFSFIYKILGASVESISDILMKTVSGSSSFIDFLVFMQGSEPDKNSIPIYAIEETKTSDVESRNTGVYQRCSKFVFIDFYYPDCRKLMLYNIEIETDSERRPTDTNIFGTRMLMTIGVEILGKTLDKRLFKPFTSISELIDFKDNMRKAPRGNVPILIRKFDDRIEVSGRLYKSGRLSHDPNIGALTIICKALRLLGWNKDIVITKHGLSQDHLTPRNKFIRIANQLNIKLDGLIIPRSSLPNEYWHYEKSSEKVATILIHLLLEENSGVNVVYEQHAGCERGYFKSKSGDCIAIHKYINDDKSKGPLRIPDLIVCDGKRKHILILEGKKWDKLTEGINALAEYDPVQREYIHKYYGEYKVSRHVVLFGGVARTIRNAHVAFLLNLNGELITSDHTPETIKEAITNISKPIWNMGQT